MRSSRLMLAAVIVAIAAVLVVKEQAKRSRGNTSTSQPAVIVNRASPAGMGKVLSGAELAGSLKNGRPTLAEFGKGACKICIKMAPILQQVAADYSGKANVISLDLDEFSATGYAYHIVAMPTQIFFDANGKEILRHLGYLSREEIDKSLAAVGTKR